MELLTIIHWNSPFLFSKMFGGIFHLNSNFNRTFYKQTVEKNNQSSHSVASDLGLHCMPMSHRKDARLIWVNWKSELCIV